MLNGKIYIGQHKVGDDKYLGSGKKITLAIKKYGKENFNRETLYRTSNLKVLNRMEVYYINKFESFLDDIGYNIATNVQNSPMLGRKHSLETKKKFRENMMGNKNLLGHIHREESKKKMSDSSKGYSPTPESIEKTRLSLLGKPKSKTHRARMRGANNVNARVIVQYGLDDTYIKKWSTAAVASRILGLNKYSIANCARGNNKTAGGFKWSYDIEN